jgi:hypothetical protein
MGTRKNFSEHYRKFGHALSKSFASPDLELSRLQYPEDEDRDGPRSVGFFAIQPFGAAGSPIRFLISVVFVFSESK